MKILGGVLIGLGILILLVTLVLRTTSEYKRQTVDGYYGRMPSVDRIVNMTFIAVGCLIIGVVMVIFT